MCTTLATIVYAHDNCVKLAAVRTICLHGLTSSSIESTYSGTTLASSRSVSRSSRMLLPLFVTSSKYSACATRSHLAQPHFQTSPRCAMCCLALRQHPKHAHLQRLIHITDVLCLNVRVLLAATH